MSRVVYISHEGNETELDLPDGTSVMMGALTHNIAGIVGECGGSAMCATCHVYVDEAWQDKLPPVSEVEEAMLESVVAERRPNSRLGCQIRMSPEIDGLVVRLPEEQM